MRLILFLLRPIFHLLYHQFAWTYDLVAATVSLGRWKGWVCAALPHLEGRVLELGFGPGHLQLALHAQGARAYGLDESRQMLRQASRRLRGDGVPVRLSRGYAQYLPFPAGTFDRVAATFPSEYIFDPHTLAEIRRVLVPGGNLVLVPMAWITGGRAIERFMAWLLRATGQTGATHTLQPIVEARFVDAGFDVRSEIVETPGSQVMVITGSRIEPVR